MMTTTLAAVVLEGRRTEEHPDMDNPDAKEVYGGVEQKRKAAWLWRQAIAVSSFTKCGPRRSGPPEK